VTSTYQALRNKYYGSHTYDFSPFVLPSFSDNLLKQGREKEALALMTLDQTHYPDSYFGNFVRAKALQQNQHTEAAIDAYKKALTLNPRARFIEAIIKQLEGESK
jgi:tetratricopeptide (TPR) repeat protein